MSFLLWFFFKVIWVEIFVASENYLKIIKTTRKKLELDQKKLNVWMKWKCGMREIGENFNVRCFIYVAQQMFSFSIRSHFLSQCFCFDLVFRCWMNGVFVLRKNSWELPDSVSDLGDKNYQASTSKFKKI